MKKMDFNCFSGNWPFFRVRCNTVEKLTQLHRRCGIEGGFISSLEAIFYQDPYEAELQLSEELRGTPYMHAMIVNPRLPAWKDDLKRARENLNIKAVRILPGFHGYGLTDPVMDEVCSALREYALPLLITLRMRDERSMWMLQSENVDMGDVAAFLEKNPDSVTIITHIRVGELDKLREQFAVRNNLFVDMSGFKDDMLPLERAWGETAARGHILYGSGAPLMEIQATALQVDTSALPEQIRNEIYSGEKLLALI